MQLTDHDLSQIDHDTLDALPEGSLRGLSKRLLDDLKEARERLNQTPENSSRPSGSMPPWYKPEETAQSDEEAGGEENEATEETTPPSPEAAPESEAPHSPASQQEASDKKAKKPGRQPGSQGYGRTHRLSIDAEEHHYPTGNCCRCGMALDDEKNDYRAYTAYDKSIFNPRQTDVLASSCTTPVTPYTN